MKKLKKTTFTLLILSSFLLSACAPLVVGGVAVTTATVMTDRRSAGSILNDEVLEKRVKFEIVNQLGKKPFNVDVTSFDGKVLLTGEVLSKEDKVTVSRVVKQSIDVKEVLNEITIQPISSATQIFTDSMLATKVRGILIGTNNISLNILKVTVNKGVVYMMGIVTENEAKMIAKKVSHIDGVKKVVLALTIETQESINARLKNLSYENQKQL